MAEADSCQTLQMSDRNSQSVFNFTRRRTLSLGVSAAAAAALLTRPRGAAAVTVDINQANVQPMPIAVSDFVGGGSGDAETAQGMSQVITANLRRCGLFAPIDPAAFLEKVTNFGAMPNFASWRTINAQALVTGRVTRQSDGRLIAEFRLWDVLAGQQLAGQQYFTTPDIWRRIAHIISDAIYERLTGEQRSLGADVHEAPHARVCACPQRVARAHDVAALEVLALSPVTERGGRVEGEL